MKMPYNECPSFEVCSAPKCPLDPDIAAREALTGEEKCRAWKPSRLKIGYKYKELLKYQGLTKREFDGKACWDALGGAERVIRLQALSKARKMLKKGILQVHV